MNVDPNKLAPVIIFTWKRLYHTKRTIEFLLKNNLASETKVIIYSDGPKSNEDIHDIESVRNYLKKIEGFKEIELKFRDENWGLARSIETGVGETVKKYGKVIVIEDDIITAPNFLNYMNDALNLYQNDEKVMHISGYSPEIDTTNLTDTFFYNQASPWGWATWERAWKFYSNDAVELKNKYDQKFGSPDYLNIDGSVDFYDHLVANIEGRLYTWAIKWWVTILINDGLVLTPKISFTENIGRDGTGEHGGYELISDNVKKNIAIRLEKLPLKESKEARAAFANYYSSLNLRNTHHPKEIVEVKTKPNIKRTVLRTLKNIIIRVPIIRNFYNKYAFYRSFSSIAVNDKNIAVNALGELYFEHELLPRIKKYPDKKIKKDKLTNILFANSLDTKGGAAGIANSVMTSMSSKGYKTSMYVNTKFTDNENVFTLPEEDRLSSLLVEFQNEQGYENFFQEGSFRLTEREEFKNADIIHLHNLHYNYFSKLALPLITSLKPTIWTFHDEEPLTDHAASTFGSDKVNEYGILVSDSLDTPPIIKKDQTEIISRTKRAVYDNSDFTIVTPSYWLAEKVKLTCLADKDIRVIQNAIDVNVFLPIDKNEARAKIGLPKDKSILIFAADEGVNNPWKGSNFIFEAYELMKTDDNILFVNIGGRSAVNRKNWLDTGYLSHDIMSLYYAAGDVFIYPTLADTFGLVVAESMSSGTPVVTFDVGPMKELVDHMQNGYLAKHKDRGDFIKGIQTFLSNDDLRLSATKKAREKIVGHFTKERMYAEYEELYKELVLK